MTRVRDFSITQKLTWMNMLVSGTALLLATGAFLGYARVVYRQTMVRYLTMRARVVGANCVSAVLFDDPKGAGDTLSALRADEHIVGAWVYTPQGEPFAGFWRDGGGSAPRMPAIAKGKPEAFWFANDQLMLIRAITFQGKLTAFVFFESDLNELRERQVRYLEIGALVLLASLLTAFLASRFFGQFVARPIRALFDTARAVSHDKDFSIRAAATDSHDEIEVLVRAFNEMLEQIQERDEAVRKSAASLAEAQQVAHVGSWEWNVETDRAWWSDEMYRLYGVEPGEFAPSLENALTRIPPADREMVRKGLQDGYEGRKPIDFDHRIVLADGSERIVHARAAVAAAEPGKPVRVVGILQDITARKRAEIAVRKTEEMLRFFVRHAPAAIAMLDREMRYLVVSERWITDYRLEGRSILGLCHYDVFPDLPEPWHEIYERCMRGAVETCEEDPFPHPDGTLDWLRWEVRPWRNVDDSIGGIIIFSELITERKRSEEELRKSQLQLAAVIETAMDGIIKVNEEQRIEIFNPSAETMFGCKASLALGRPLDFLIPERYRDAHGEHIRLFGESNVTRRTMGKPGIVWGKRANGDEFPIEASIAQAEVAGRKMYTVILRDITERKRAEDTLNKRTEELAQSQQTLEQKVQELARSNADLEQFAYIASHDLQEPLRTVASFAQLLQRRYKGKLDSNADEFIHYMVDGASRMQGLINDLWAFSRVGSRGKEFAPADFATIVELALSNLQTAIAESHAEVTHDPLPTLKCDGAQLAQVFQNLVGNGIKFHNSQSPHVHIGAIRKDSEWVFSVKDNGIGIDPQFNQRIFEVFQRLHTRKEYPGSGIGLSITKKIVERHGGRIWVESQPGEGANFLFTLPA